MTIQPIIDVEAVDEDEHGTVAALAPIKPGDALVRPAASVADVESAFRDYQRLCQHLLDSDDVQHIGGRSFRKKSAWRKLAVAFGVSCEVRERDYERDDQGRIVRAEVVVRAIAPNGRYMDGLGVCDMSERKFSKPQHDIPATAMTRATNRACADLFGMGEVSAEEIVDDAQPVTRRAPSQGQRANVRQPEPAHDAETTAYVVETLKPLPEAARAEWKAWRATQGVSWPIVSDDAAAARGMVANLVARYRDDDAPF